MKILIADDHALFRDGLAMRLEQINPDIVLHQAPTFSQAIKILDKEHNIDMVIVDLDMPDMRWEDGIEEIKKKAPNSSMVVISASEDIRNIRKILATGIKGYIPKRSEPKIMHNALKLILDGGTYIPPALIENSAEHGANGYKGNGKTLTNRQSQVLDLIAQGKSNKQIAYEMGVSEATVKLHINALLRSLKVNNRTQAVVTAQKMGII
ncbi:MAG: response regulator transcription factor [Alphaproteobacteria bacterium]|nr:response regulator transcription factor [Alphaproteobacteria bacterium]